MWFTAHVIMWIRFKEGVQDYFPAEENLLLISAPSPKEALEEAKQLAVRKYAGDDSGSLRCDGRPAERVFGAVRHLIEVEDADRQPGHGTELTYQFLLADTKEQFDALVGGADARVLLKECNDADAA